VQRFVGRFPARGSDQQPQSDYCDNQQNRKIDAVIYLQSSTDNISVGLIRKQRPPSDGAHHKKHKRLKENRGKQNPPDLPMMAVQKNAAPDRQDGKHEVQQL
jgi:hypothetical protein